MIYDPNPTGPGDIPPEPHNRVMARVKRNKGEKVKRKRKRIYSWGLPGEMIETAHGFITNREWLEKEVERINQANPRREALLVRAKDRKISIEYWDL